MSLLHGTANQTGPAGRRLPTPPVVGEARAQAPGPPLTAVQAEHCPEISGQGGWNPVRALLAQRSLLCF